jgi:hypothetical protein
MQTNEQEFRASHYPQLKFSQTPIARHWQHAIGSAPLLLAFVLTMTGCGVSFNTFPTVRLSPATISVHKVDVGGTSGAKVITITNTSPNTKKLIPLSISAFNLTGDFIQTATTCPALPATLAPGASCTVSVAFRPQSSGALTGAFSLVDNGTNTPPSVALSATGGIGFLLFSPTSLAFPGVASMTVSQPQTASLTNEATFPVTIQKVTVSGKFAESDDCPKAPDTLAPGGSCTVAVTSNPVVAGDITGAVNVYDIFGNVTQLYLSGNDQGRQATGELAFTPASLQWGKMMVGASAAAKTVTVTNFSPSTVNFSSIVTGPDFFVSATTCGNGLGGGSSCTVSVMFRPTTTGSISELLTFNDNLTGSPQAISLRGTGILGDMLFTPTSLLFAGVNPGSASPAQAATLTNETAGNIGLTSISVSGHFAQTDNCPATLGPQESCTFEVTSDPITAGAITGSVNVKDSLGNGIQLYLQGQGGGVNQVLSFSPNPIVWGKLNVGQESASKTLTVDNGQTAPVTFYSVSVPQDWVETASTCPSAPDMLPAGASCTISLAFRPYSAGAKSEVITFTDDAPGGTQSVSLMGTAVVGSLLFNPSSLSFAGIQPNTVSPSQTATLTNEGTVGVTLASITMSGHFAQTNDCPDTLDGGGSCTFTITSNPVVDGPTQGSVNVRDSNGNTTLLFLSGEGGVPTDPSGSLTSQVTIAPTSLALGDVNLGQTSGASAIVLSNGQTDPVTIWSITTGPDVYETANMCPMAPETLAGGASCTVSVTFRPQSVGSKSEPLTVTANSWSSPHAVTITGTGVGGNLLFNPISLSFPSEVAGSTSSAQTAILTNQLTTSITLMKIQAMGTFVQTNDCPNTLDVGASCTVSVSANPQMTGDFTGSVDVTDSTGAVTQLYLSGTATVSTDGTTSLAAVSPSALTLGKVIVGGSSGVKTLTFNNNQRADSAVSVAVTPQTSCVLPSTTEQLTANVMNTSNTAVNWYVDGKQGGKRSSGTISAGGLYQAPGATDTHTINAVSQARTTTSSSTTLSVASSPIPSGMSLPSETDVNLIRIYALVPQAYATQTPDWTRIDPSIAKLQAAGMHVPLRIAFTPLWLQSNPNP